MITPCVEKCPLSGTSTELMQNPTNISLKTRLAPDLYIYGITVNLASYERREAQQQNIKTINKAKINPRKENFPSILQSQPQSDTIQI